jgi:hypothetical protein
MLIMKNILIIILLVFSCSICLSLLPKNINEIPSILIIFSHVIIFILYSLNLKQEEIIEDKSNKVHKRISTDKKDYIILNKTDIGNKKVIEYKSNISDKTYFIEEKEFYDKFVEVK